MYHHSHGCIIDFFIIPLHFFPHGLIHSYISLYCIRADIIVFKFIFCIASQSSSNIPIT